MSKWKKSLKRISVYSILLFLLIGFIRCQFIIDIFSEDTSIAPEILPFFEEGDTIIFNCNSNVDSFYVERSRFYKVGEDDGSGDDMNYERFFSRLIQLDCSDSCYEFWSKIIPRGYYCAVDNKSFELVDYDKRFADLTRQIGSYHLEELYGSYNLEPDSITGNEINFILYSKKYGVVEYRLTNNDVFQIEIESLEMIMARE